MGARGERRFDRQSGGVRGMLGALFAPAPDPRRFQPDDAARRGQALREIRIMSQRLRETRGRLAEQVEQQRQGMSRLDSEARSALKEQRDDVARYIIARQLRAQRAIDTLTDQIGTLDRDIAQLDLLEQRLVARAEEIAARREMIAAGFDATEARLRVNDLFATSTDEFASADAELAGVQEAHLRLQARVSAIDQLVDDGVLPAPADGWLTTLGGLGTDDPDDAQLIDAALARLRDA